LLAHFYHIYFNRYVIFETTLTSFFPRLYYIINSQYNKSMTTYHSKVTERSPDNAVIALFGPLSLHVCINWA